MSIQLRTGYKQTEVGVIPKDWEVRPLLDVCRFRSGKAHEQHISESGQYICVNSKFISTEGRVRKHTSANFCPAKKGDVLMVMSDLPNGKALAKAYLVDTNNFYAVNQRVCALSPYRDSPEYLYYVLNRNPYFLKFDDGVNQTHLLNRVFEKCLLPIPTDIEEQRVIGEALSDSDSLIQSLEQLLAKKRYIRQGMMHKLLTGEKRLPGFSGQWSVKTLGSICNMKSGEAITSENVDEYSEFPCFGGNGLRGFTKTYNHDGNFALIGRQGALCGNVLVATGRFFASEHAVVVTPNRDTDVFWLARVLVRMNLNQYSESSAQPGLSVSKLLVLECTTPPHAEQTAIASILSDMDAEIAELETQLAKTRVLKQGMMHKLLTGEIRLL